MSVALLMMSFYFGVSGNHATTKPLKSWEGQLDNVKYESHPAFVIDQKQWNLVWKKWSTEEVPTVDFNKEMVLVFSTIGANSITVKPIIRDQEGNLRVMAIYTLQLSKGVSYKWLLIPRAGVKSVNTIRIK